jgi:endonuclease/exonuclease/phosphatase family metal-dependent hydrolase
MCILFNDPRITQRGLWLRRMSFALVTLNTFTPVPEPVRFCGQRTRLKKIAQVLPTINQGNVDAFVLCECIIESVFEDLLQPMAKRGWRYCTKPLVSANVMTNQSLLPSIMSGGVFILSKWPIVREDRHVYRNAIGADSMVAKGVVYARIMKEGKMFNVLGTHLQAWKSADARSVRIQQTLEIRDFVTKLELSSDEPLMLAGDFNIDRDSEFVDLQNFLHITEMNMPPIVGSERHTVSKNNELYGVDDPTQYTNESWPNGCFDVYKDTLRCVCCADAWVDYVLTSRVHQLPLKHTSSIQALPLRVERYNVQLCVNTWRKVRDITDHYAVIGQFMFPQSLTEDIFEDASQNHRHQHQRQRHRHPQPLISCGENVDNSHFINHSMSTQTILCIVTLLILVFVVVVWTIRSVRHKPQTINSKQLSQQ